MLLWLMVFYPFQFNLSFSRIKLNGNSIALSPSFCLVCPSFTLLPSLASLQLHTPHTSGALKHFHHLTPVTLLYCSLRPSFSSTVIWHCWTQYDLTPSASGYAIPLGLPDSLSAALFFSHTLQAVIISLSSSISSLYSFPHYLTP